MTKYSSILDALLMPIYTMAHSLLMDSFFIVFVLPIRLLCCFAARERDEVSLRRPGMFIATLPYPKITQHTTRCRRGKNCISRIRKILANSEIPWNNSWLAAFAVYRLQLRRVL